MRELRIVAVDIGAHTMELRDDVGAVLATDVGAAGHDRLRQLAVRALGRRNRFDRLIWRHPGRPTRRTTCLVQPGDVIVVVSLRPPIPETPPGCKPSYCTCGNTGSLRYCRKCREYKCRSCMSSSGYRCYSCTRNHKEDDMGMKPRNSRTTTAVSRRALNGSGRQLHHKSGEGGCGEIWPGGSSVWGPSINCSKCLQNHPDRLPVPDYLEEAAGVLIHNALTAAADKGLRVKKGSCSNCNGVAKGTVCCVCAPVMFREKLSPTEDVDEICAKLLGVPGKWLYDFVTGFDGDGRPGMYPSAYKLGRRMARKHGAA